MGLVLQQSWKPGRSLPRGLQGQAHTASKGSPDFLPWQFSMGTTWPPAGILQRLQTVLVVTTRGHSWHLDGTGQACHPTSPSAQRSSPQTIICEHKGHCNPSPFSKDLLRCRSPRSGSVLTVPVELCKPSFKSLLVAGPSFLGTIKPFWDGC